MVARLKQKYDDELLGQVREQFSIENVHAAPRLKKITVNMGIGKAIENNKRIEIAAKEMAQITGQAPSIRRAKKSISNFKLREDYAIGCKVTLRRDRMYEFLDRLISVVIPRIRDFRGFRMGAFDGRGNYALGLADQVVFPEINIDRIEYVQGMDICFTIDNSDDEKSLALMKGFGFPFRTDR
ncbi:MAG: 50S ribosomal protein L5 [Planctomycetota bacterium]